VCDCGCAALQDRLEARDQFIGVLGHELRNTIAPLALLADHFEQLALTSHPQLTAKVGMLSRNLKKLTTTIDRLAEVSSLRAGKLALACEHVDLRDVLDEVSRELAPDAAHASADLRVYYTTPVQGWWDRERLTQVVRNLVANAIRFSGGAPIEISTQLTGRDAEIVVHDQGPGVPNELRAHLFDRFDHKTPSRGSSFGVGLFVVKALCQAMGGSVRLDEAATGARFCVTLPRG
jgi:signal transduction histidine kinase